MGHVDTSGATWTLICATSIVQSVTATLKKSQRIFI